jgi:hypothetical protein
VTCMHRRGSLRLIAGTTPLASGLCLSGSVSLCPAGPWQPSLGDLRYLLFPAKPDKHSSCISEGVMNLKVRLAGVATGTFHTEPKAHLKQIGQEQDKIGCHHCSVVAGNMHYKGDTKRRCTILILISLYTEWEMRPLSW